MLTLLPFLARLETPNNLPDCRSHRTRFSQHSQRLRCRWHGCWCPPVTRDWPHSHLYQLRCGTSQNAASTRRPLCRCGEAHLGPFRIRADWSHVCYLLDVSLHQNSIVNKTAIPYLHKLSDVYALGDLANYGCSLITGSHVLTGTIAWNRIVGEPSICALVWGVISMILLFLVALPPTFAEFAILGYIDFVSIIIAIGITIIATGVKAGESGLGKTPLSALVSTKFVFVAANAIAK
jgi:hypothetical protein